ncbi:hypothetical protein L484_001505 [Morus notabilis]|uniref:Uncharacterized protein n=1 Tax=Morus notabilis TaxID=981085 RepID=W9S486_9ROSA|nr:hypothetical protein L484_001505 [Morus notabilis]
MTATTFGVVTGPISRLIEALFAFHNRHKNGNNFWCRNGAQNLSESARPSTATGRVTNFGVVTGPISR